MVFQSISDDLKSKMSIILSDTHWRLDPKYLDSGREERWSKTEGTRGEREERRDRGRKRGREREGGKRRKERGTEEGWEKVI